MRLKQLVNTDRPSSVKLRMKNTKRGHSVGDKAPGGRRAMEDLTGEELEPALVKRNEQVWTVMKRDDAHRRGMDDSTNTVKRHQRRR